MILWLGYHFGDEDGLDDILGGGGGEEEKEITETSPPVIDSNLLELGLESAPHQKQHLWLKIPLRVTFNSNHIFLETLEGNW